MNINIFILHHTPAKERKRTLLNNIESIKIDYPVDWIEAFLPNEIQNFNKGNISYSELSLLLKHKLVWEQTIQNELNYSIVFEDDVNLLSVENLNNFLRKGVEELHAKAGDLLWIGNIKKWNMYHIPEHEKNINNFAYFNKECFSRCTHAYIISQKAAQIMLDNVHYNLPVDHLYNDIIQKKNLISGWSEPFLTQYTAEGIWPTTL